MSVRSYAPTSFDLFCGHHVSKNVLSASISAFFTEVKRA